LYDLVESYFFLFIFLTELNYVEESNSGCWEGNWQRELIGKDWGIYDDIIELPYSKAVIYIESYLKMKPKKPTNKYRPMPEPLIPTQ
jgi:hypothetical protein